MSLIGELPLSELSGLIEYAEEREAEEAARPLYIAHFMLQKMNGAEPMGYDDYLAQVLNREESAGALRDPEAIERELSEVEAAYRARKEA